MLTKINICWKRARRFITRHLLWVKLGLCRDVYKKPAVSKYTPPAALRVTALSSAAAWASHAVFFPLNVCFHPPMQGSHLAQWSGLLELESNWLKFYHVPAQWCCHHYQMFLMRTHRHPLSGFPFFSFFRRFSRTGKDCFTSQRRKHQRFLHLVSNLFIYLLLCGIINYWRLVSKIFKMCNQKIPS